MFAVLLVLLLAGGAQSAMVHAPAPDWVSRTLDEPTYRPGVGASLRLPAD